MDQLAALRERNQMLEEENRQLQELLTPTCSWVGLTPGPVTHAILRTLATGRAHSTEQLLRIVEMDVSSNCEREGGDIMRRIYHLRLNLARLVPPIRIMSARGRGNSLYWIDKENLALLAARRVT